MGPGTMTTLTERLRLMKAAPSVSPEWSEAYRAHDEESLATWIAFCHHLAQVRGPEGITLGNTNPLIMENLPLQAQYTELRARYNSLLGNRKVPNTKEDDMVLAIKDKRSEQSLVGYSFFPVRINKDPFTHAKERLFRQIEERNDPRKTALLAIADILQQEPGINRRATAPSTTTPSMSMGDKMRKLSEVVRDSKIEEVIVPTVSATGGIKTVYSDFIPAIILKSIIPQVKSPYIDLHVICRGFEDVRNYEISVHELFKCGAFREAAGKEIQPGIVRRICTWLRSKGHVSMIVWDAFYDMDDKIKHRCYTANSVDSIGDRLTILALKTLIEENSGGAIELAKF